ncbi:MAG: septal ring lytic transglycosylase RlpA family protein [Pseudomonadota bacterium]
MAIFAGREFRGARFVVALMGLLALAISGCSATPPKSNISNVTPPRATGPEISPRSSPQSSPWSSPWPTTVRRRFGEANGNRRTTGPRRTAGPRRGKRRGYRKVGKPYQIKGIWYTPRVDPNYDATGIASFYAHDFHDKPTANGETFDMHALTAAHKTLPLPSYVIVQNLENGRRVKVRVNDRGPFVAGRIIDLSKRAAQVLGFKRQGLAQVRVTYVGPAPLDDRGEAELAFLRRQPWSGPYLR